MIINLSVFSRFFVETPTFQDSPFEPQIQGSEITDSVEIKSSGGQRGDRVNNPTEIQSSDGKRKQFVRSVEGTVSKY